MNGISENWSFIARHENILKIIAIIVIILYLVNVNYNFIARYENILKNYCNYSNNIIPGECQL